MSDVAAALARLAAAPGVRLDPPAGDAAVARFEADTGLTLPPAARELYRACGGADLVPGRVRLTSLDEARPLTLALNQGVLGDWGLLPLTEANDSDPVCVFTKPPLTGYVVLVFHDDGPRLLFRSVPDFLTATADALTGPGFEFRDLRPAFAEAARTADDRRAARELLATDDPPMPEWAYSFALTLLGDEDVTEIAGLLEHENFSVGYAARDRLAGMTTPAAAVALAAHDAEFRRFAARLRDELTAAGLTATLVEQHGRPAVRLDPGPRWLHLEAFFPLRNRPDGFAEIVRQVRSWPR